MDPFPVNLYKKLSFQQVESAILEIPMPFPSSSSYYLLLEELCQRYTVHENSLTLVTDWEMEHRTEKQMPHLI